MSDKQPVGEEELEIAKSGVNNLVADINTDIDTVDATVLDYVYTGNSSYSEGLHNLYLGIKPTLLVSEDYFINYEKTSASKRFQTIILGETGNILIINPKAVERRISTLGNYFTKDGVRLSVDQALTSISGNRTFGDDMLREGLLLGYPVDAVLQFCKYEQSYDYMCDILTKKLETNEIEAEDVQTATELVDFSSFDEGVKAYVQLEQGFTDAERNQRNSFESILRKYIPELEDDQIEYLAHGLSLHMHGLHCSLGIPSERDKEYLKSLEYIQVNSGLFTFLSDFREKRELDLRRK